VIDRLGRLASSSASRLRRIPRPLLLLTLGVLVHNVAWIVALPAWQGPDEFSHYSYVERLAADHRLMRFDHRDDPASLSAAANYSMVSTGFNDLRFRLPERPFGAAGLDVARYPAEPDGLAQQNHGALGANSYPPVYYIAAWPLYSLPWLSNATEREYSIRLLSALLGALIVPLTYRLGRAVALSRRAALLAAALATSAPIMTQQSAVFSPDVLLVVAITGLADACVRARDRLDRRAVARVLAWGALAALTKPVGLPAAGAVLAVIAILTLGRLRARTRAGLLVGASAVGLVLGSLFASTLFGVAVPATISWTARLEFDGEYLWQYYLPRLPGMPLALPPATPASPPAAWMWGKEGIGILGWLTTFLPLWAYRLAWIPTVFAGGLALAGGVFGSARERTGRNLIPALVVASIAYIVVLHASEATYVMGTGNRLLQGRYFLPIYPLVAVAVMAGLRRFGERLALSVGLAVLAAWTIVALEALDVVTVYFG
jgi:4-amino-4-deoxy-L-arabinose transferase-like glycosyltransferase